MRLLPSLPAVVPALVLAAVLVTGCAGGDEGCSGHAYHPSLDQEGSETPIRALEVWLGSHEGFDQEPPDAGWIQQDTGEEDPARVVLTNEDGDGWWVSTVRTSSGGYVVEQATDNATACGDELP